MYCLFNKNGSGLLDRVILIVLFLFAATKVLFENSGNTFYDLANILVSISVIPYIIIKLLRKAVTKWKLPEYLVALFGLFILVGITLRIIYYYDLARIARMEELFR